MKAHKKRHVTKQELEFLQKAILIVGGQTALAEKCGVKQPTVASWLENGLPSERVLQVEELVKGEIKCYQFRPDLYPPARFATIATKP